MTRSNQYPFEPIKARTLSELKITDKKQNQSPVAIARYKPYANLTTFGVSADTTTAKIDKKNRVAFGLSPLVRKPIINAFLSEIMTSLAPLTELLSLGGAGL